MFPLLQIGLSREEKGGDYKNLLLLQIGLGREENGGDFEELLLL